jgi:alpha-amylase/alpha-mannosidase (GH57 family)
MPSRYLCIHGHFYQPPRENPWLEEVELQESAAPFHDWNQRITAECYAPNTASRILDQDKRILFIVNNYSQISFNFGPTLLSWLQKHQPETYQGILEADRQSQKRFSGHGSALAQVYNHMIMPLASRRDKQTQVQWGIQDFQHRFGRFPEGMWLPETAVDTQSLEVLAEKGIRFTILAQHQAARIRPLQAGKWIDVQGGKVDPTRPYLCHLPSGREIAIFFYDGPISQDIAFGGLLNNGEHLAARLSSGFSQERDWPQLVHVATDGETYGHHHRMGDMALAFCLFYVEAQDLARLTIYGEYLEKHPPQWEVEILENSSWSCAHGVKRWQEDCGCKTGLQPKWQQKWRKPLRQGMDLLRDRLGPLYQEQAAQYLHDPWQARDEYIQVLLDRSQENVQQFLQRHKSRSLELKEISGVLMLLEMQRHCMLMYTSCGWFFDEVAGLEAIQIMRYAARAMQLAAELGTDSLQQEYLKILEQAPSNRYTQAREVFERFVQPAKVDFPFLAGHFALFSLFVEDPEDIQLYCYSAQNQSYQRLHEGSLRLALGCSRLISQVTWQERQICFAAVYLGGHNAHCGLDQDMGEQEFQTMQQEIKEIFHLGDLPNLIRCMDRHFGTQSCTLWHLFKDEQQKVLQEILYSSLEEIHSEFRQILEQNHALINFLTRIQTPIPRTLQATAETVINTELEQLLEQDTADLDRLQQLIKNAREWEIQLESTSIGFKAGWYIDFQMQRLQELPENLELLQHSLQLLRILQPLQLDLNLWKSQNIVFELVRRLHYQKSLQARKGDAEASSWLELISSLGELLAVNIS